MPRIVSSAAILGVCASPAWSGISKVEYRIDEDESIFQIFVAIFRYSGQKQIGISAKGLSKVREIPRIIKDITRISQQKSSKLTLIIKWQKWHLDQKSASNSAWRKFGKLQYEDGAKR